MLICLPAVQFCTALCSAKMNEIIIVLINNMIKSTIISII